MRARAKTKATQSKSPKRVKKTQEINKIKSGSGSKDDPAQSKRFIEMAKELGGDDDPKAFEKTVKRVAPTKKATKPRKAND